MTPKRALPPGLLPILSGLAALVLLASVPAAA
jgi:hypothetical protein